MHKCYMVSSSKKTYFCRRVACAEPPDMITGKAFEPVWLAVSS